jgi:hypothetical protein
VGENTKENGLGAPGIGIGIGIGIAIILDQQIEAGGSAPDAP